MGRSFMVLGVSTEVMVIGAVWLAALVPVLWAIVDVVRRPSWQFTPGRKAAWAVTLGIGWLVPFLFPFTLVTAIIYLVAVRRKLPPAAAAGPEPGRPHPGWGTGAWSGGSAADPWATPRRAAGPAAPPEEAARPTPKDLPQAGWYADPAGGGGQRWWDGVGWTDHTR